MNRVIRIAPAWRINHDRLQWILEHKRGRRWYGVSFIESDKRVLRRVLREKRIIHDAGALDALPETFAEDRAAGFKQDISAADPSGATTPTPWTPQRVSCPL